MSTRICSAWLKRLAGLTAEECDLLENYVLKWDIHGQTWLRDEDWTENPDGYGAPWNDRRQAVLTQVNQLCRRVPGTAGASGGGLEGRGDGPGLYRGPVRFQWRS